MPRPQITRRRFVQSAATGTLWTAGATTAQVAQYPMPVKIREPFHGAVLNHRHGKESKDGLTIRVSGEARPGDRVTINGAPCQREGKRFSAEVTLRDKETDLIAVAAGESGGHRNRVRVVWDRYSEPRYRLSIDDNSFFLRDIAQKGCKSLFDCWYLKMLRDLHTKYGVKYTLNIYYTTGSDFSLPQFSDRYKGEWRDNGHWLRLAFHAYADKPDRPYQDTPPEKMLADMDLAPNGFLGNWD